MSMAATAGRAGNSLRHGVDVNDRHVIATDEPLSLGGDDTGPAPHELLAATLASCVATMIAMYAQKRNWELGELSVDVVYDNESTPRRFALVTPLPSGLSPDQRRRLARVAQPSALRRAPG